MDGELFDESALGPPGAPSDSRTRTGPPPLIGEDGVTAPQTRRPAKGRATKREQELLDLKDELIAEAVKFGATMTPVLPTTGAYMCKGSPDAMGALVDLCKESPQAIEALKTVAKMAPGVTLGRYAAGLGVCAMVDFKKIAPDSVAARSLGVTHVWVKTHPKEADEAGVYLPDPSPVTDFPEI